MAALHKIIASVRAALDHGSAPALHHESQPLPSSEQAREAGLAAQFARELERVGGVCFLPSVTSVSEHILQVARENDVKRAVLGAGLTAPIKDLTRSLRAAGLEVSEAAPVTDPQRPAMRAAMAACHLGVIEADYAIAATGTLCVVASPGRPSSLTILPPINFIMIHPRRILPTLADVIAEVGPATFSSRRVALITGPSRTADIEKLIVIGVHGPKRLYSAIIA